MRDILSVACFSGALFRSLPFFLLGHTTHTDNFMWRVWLLATKLFREKGNHMVKFWEVKYPFGIACILCSVMNSTYSSICVTIFAVLLASLLYLIRACKFGNNFFYGTWFSLYIILEPDQMMCEINPNAKWFSLGRTSLLMHMRGMVRCLIRQLLTTSFPDFPAKSMGFS